LNSVGWSGDSRTDLVELTRMIGSGEIDDFLQEEESDRDLQLTTLTVTFNKGTVFEVSLYMLFGSPSIFLLTVVSPPGKQKHSRKGRERASWYRYVH
jgi:hypothetical protein